MGVMQKRAVALGVLATGLVCPCHALVGVLSLVMGASVLSPAAQDGVHAIYVPTAISVGALLLRRRQRTEKYVTSG
jgi:hypothetical protein